MRQNNSYVIDSDISYKDKEYILTNCNYISIDTETTGLDPLVSNLCTIQIVARDIYYIIQFDKKKPPFNFMEIIENRDICKIFHHANFDIRFIMHHLEISKIENVVCTKVAAKILYGLKEKNSLKDLLEKKLGIKISKEQQLSDWSAQKLDAEQVKYALNDVKYLADLWEALKIELEYKGLYKIAEKCFDFLPTQALLQNLGIENIFTY